MTSKRAGAYGRQSHASLKSVDEQLDACVADIDREGDTCVAKYSDGKSASRYATNQRGGWERLLTDLDNGELDVIVMWESSRGDRTLASWAAFLDLCRKHGVLIRVTEHRRTYNMRVARDWRTLAEDGVDNAYESERTAARVRRGVAGAAVAGKPHGQVPYGYQRHYDPVTKALIEQSPHPERAAIVREIYRRVKAEDPLSTITNDLNKRGIPSPYGKAWIRKTVRNIAMNPAYIGTRVHRSERECEETGNVVTFRETYAGTWPGLVDETTFLKVQCILTNRKRKTTRPGGARYMLSYIARCGECNGPMQVQPARTHTAARYRCFDRSCLSIGLAELDSFVMDELISYLSTLDLRALGSAAEDANVIDARNKAERLRLELNGALDSVGKPGGLTWQGAQRIETNLRPQIEAAEAAERRAIQASRPPILAELASVDDIADHVRTAPVAARRSAVSAFLTVRVLPAARRGSRSGPGTPAEERVTITRRKGALVSPLSIPADEGR